MEASTCNTSVMMVSTVASRPDAISAGMTGLRQPAISSRKLDLQVRDNSHRQILSGMRQP